jgi:hypothetical protein
LQKVAQLDTKKWSKILEEQCANAVLTHEYSPTRPLFGEKKWAGVQ